MNKTTKIDWNAEIANAAARCAAGPHCRECGGSIVSVDGFGHYQYCSRVWTVPADGFGFDWRAARTAYMERHAQGAKVME